MSEPTVVAASERAGQSGVAGGPGRRWWILGVVGLAQLMVVLDRSAWLLQLQPTCPDMQEPLATTLTEETRGS
jgi:hypothetical protein